MKSKKKRRRRLNPLLKVPRRDPNTPFKCDLCGSPYVINPTRRGNRPKLSTHHPSPRHKVDPATGKTLTLCNACGLFLHSVITCTCDCIFKRGKGTRIFCPSILFLLQCKELWKALTGYGQFNYHDTIKSTNLKDWF